LRNECTISNCHSTSKTERVCIVIN
jgi:hypothetical protein